MMQCERCTNEAKHHKYDLHLCDSCFFEEFNRRAGVG